MRRDPGRCRLWPLLLSSLAACGAEVASTATFDIVSGEPSGVAEVVALVFDGSPFCSALLLDEYHLLTAAHCVVDSAAISVRAEGAGVDDRTLAIGSAHLHPDYDRQRLEADVAVARLSDPVRYLGPPPRIPALGPDDVGAEVRLVGWGLVSRDAPSYEGRREGTARIEEVRDTTLRLAPAPATACIGDSGGPALRRSPSGVALVGIVVSGDDQCAGHTTVARADVVWPFVEEALDPAEGGCQVLARPHLGDGSFALILIVIASVAWLSVRSRRARFDRGCRISLTP